MRQVYKALLLAGIPLVIMTAIGVAPILQGAPAGGRSVIAVGVIVGFGMLVHGAVRCKIRSFSPARRREVVR